jgi:hypothetical protein
MSRELHGCFALGSRIRILDLTAPSGKLLEQHPLLQGYLSAFLSKMLEWERNSSTPDWDATIL